MTAQFVDCNCAAGDKCPQGKTGQRTRCFIPANRASVGGRPVVPIEQEFDVIHLLQSCDELGGMQPKERPAAYLRRLIDALVAKPASAEPALICKGAWSLGSACGKCERCVATALEGYPVALADVRKAEERLDAIGAILRVGGHGFDASPTFKLAAFEEARRLVVDEPRGSVAETVLKELGPPPPDDDPSFEADRIFRDAVTRHYEATNRNRKEPE